MEALFHASYTPGLSPSGCACKRRAVLLSEPLPSCRCFQALFSSEEQKTTRSVGCRAFIPPVHRNNLPKQIIPTPSWCSAPPEFSLPKRCETCVPLPSCTSEYLTPKRPKPQWSQISLYCRALPHQNWLVSLKTADSHGVLGLVADLAG